MQKPEIIKKTETFDVVIVGSGAAGGWAAKTLTEAGLKVAVIELGRKLDPAKDFHEHKPLWDFPLRTKFKPKDALREKPIQFATAEEATHQFFVSDIDHPYVQKSPFVWIRGNQVGGKTLSWGRQVYRLSDLDFKAASRDGVGIDWPLNYRELEPYYDRVERYIGVSGQAEGLPHLPDGKFLPPMRLSCGEWMLKNAIREKFGRTLTIARTAVLTANHNGRSKCHMCGPCERGCSSNSFFYAGTTTIQDAAKTGKMSLFPDTLASHVTLNDKGRAQGVWCVDVHSKRHFEIRGRAIVLCASTLASTRLLLNSTSSRFRNGLANSSGVLGHYLMDHLFRIGASGKLPKLTGVRDPSGNRPTGFYIARFRNVDKKDPGFIRGYGYQGTCRGKRPAEIPSGFGRGLMEAIRTAPDVWTAGLFGFGEVLPQWENGCSLSKEKTDKWGIPALEVSMRYGDNEKAMAKDMANSAAEMLKAAGAEDVSTFPNPAPPGESIHELGTARMGDDPKTSVLNKWNQTHDVPNLFVTDGACFPSVGCQNPTLTIMAVTVRACDHIIERFRRGEFRT